MEEHPDQDQIVNNILYPERTQPKDYTKNFELVKQRFEDVMNRRGQLGEQRIEADNLLYITRRTFNEYKQKRTEVIRGYYIPTQDTFRIVNSARLYKNEREVTDEDGVSTGEVANSTDIQLKQSKEAQIGVEDEIQFKKIEGLQESDFKYGDVEIHLKDNTNPTELEARINYRANTNGFKLDIQTSGSPLGFYISSDTGKATQVETMYSYAEQDLINKGRLKVNIQGATVKVDIVDENGVITDTIIAPLRIDLKSFFNASLRWN